MKLDLTNLLGAILPTPGKRKLWVSIVSAICAAFLGIYQLIEWDTAALLIATSLGGFLGLEGLADIATRLGTAQGAKKK